MTEELDLIDSVIEDAVSDIENSSCTVDADERVVLTVKFQRSFIDLGTKDELEAVSKTIGYVQLMAFGRTSPVHVIDETNSVIFEINETFSSYRVPLYFLYLINKAFSGSLDNIIVCCGLSNHILTPEQLHKTHDMFMRTNNSIIDKNIFNELWATVIVPFYSDDNRKKPIIDMFGENYRAKFLDLYDSYLNYGNYNKNKEIIYDDCLDKFIGMTIDVDPSKMFRGDSLIASTRKADTYDVPKEFRNMPTMIAATRTFIRDKMEFIKTNSQQPVMLQTLVLLREPYLKGDDLWISYCSVYYHRPENTDDFSEEFWKCFSNLIICK